MDSTKITDTGKPTIDDANKNDNHDSTDDTANPKITDTGKPTTELLKNTTNIDSPDNNYDFLKVQATPNIDIIREILFK